MFVVTPALRALRRVAESLANLLPDVPSSDAPPLDIDGRRQADPDPEALRRVDRARKNGKGGSRPAEGRLTVQA